MQRDPEITAVNINVTPELASPLAGDTVVATIEAEGGTSPFTYELVEGSGDNSLFSITGNEVKIMPKFLKVEIRVSQ